MRMNLGSRARNGECAAAINSRVQLHLLRITPAQKVTGVDRKSRKRLTKSIAAEVSYRLMTGQDFSLAEIAEIVRNRHSDFDADLLLAFRKAAEEALRRKSGSRHSS